MISVDIPFADDQSRGVLVLGEMMSSSSQGTSPLEVTAHLKRLEISLRHTKMSMLEIAQETL